MIRHILARADIIGSRGRLCYRHSLTDPYSGNGVVEAIFFRYVRMKRLTCHSGREWMNLFDDVVAKFRAVYPVSWHIGNQVKARCPCYGASWVDGKWVYLDVDAQKARRILGNVIDDLERCNF